MDNIDINFTVQPPHPYHNRHQVLQKYTAALLKLRTLAELSHRVTPFYFDNYIIFQYFQQRSNGGSSTESLSSFLKLELLRHILDRRRQICYWLFYLLVALLCVFVYRQESTSSLVAERGMQSFVYPGMRMWRRMTMPIIERFPRLTELYDESCLMENPFFEFDDLSCEPCARVQSVLDLTNGANDANTVDKSTTIRNDDIGNSDVSSEREQATQFVPFVFKINQTPIHLDDIHKVYTANYETFQRDAFRVQSTNPDVNNLDQLFTQFNSTQPLQAHNLWRCNRMLPARLLRQLFTRPSRLPNTGLALERFVAIDTAQASAYTLPDTECANVYIQQALGTRFIILRPMSACRHKCRTLSIRLPQSFVLSYNWWYWKPISAPDPVGDTLSISLIGSYC